MVAGGTSPALPVHTGTRSSAAASLHSSQKQAVWDARSKMPSSEEDSTVQALEM